MFNKGLGWLLPANIRGILQAVLIAFDAFILAYRAARDIQANRLKKKIDDTAEKIQDPRLTLEERLALNAKMEGHYKDFVSDVDSK